MSRAVSRDGWKRWLKPTFTTLPVCPSRVPHRHEILEAMPPGLLDENVAARLERRQRRGTESRVDRRHDRDIGLDSLQARRNRVRDPEAGAGDRQGCGKRLGSAEVEIDERDHLRPGRERLQALATDEPAADHRHPGHVRTSCLVRIHVFSER